MAGEEKWKNSGRLRARGNKGVCMCEKERREDKREKRNLTIEHTIVALLVLGCSSVALA